MSPYDPAGPIIHRKPLFAGAALAAVGSLVALVGMVISVLTTAAGARRWVGAWRSARAS
jgi:hypothetical protein